MLCVGAPGCWLSEQNEGGAQRPNPWLGPPVAAAEGLVLLVRPTHQPRLPTGRGGHRQCPGSIRAGSAMP